MNINMIEIVSPHTLTKSCASQIVPTNSVNSTFIWLPTEPGPTCQLVVSSLNQDTGPHKVNYHLNLFKLSSLIF